MISGNKSAIETACFMLLICVLSAAPHDGSTAPNESCLCHDQPYWVEQVAGGFEFPSSIAWLPTGEVLITERHRGPRILRDDVLDLTPIRGIPSSVGNNIQAFLDIALDPEFKSNHTLYLLVAEGTYQNHHTVAYRAHYIANELSNLERIFSSNSDIGGNDAYAGRFLFLQDKTLLIAVPEDHLHKEMAQNLGSHVGKIVRMNRDGSVPPDNPFLKFPHARPEIWSYGHRTQTGMYRDTETDAIWEVEPGPRGGDELNLLKAGGNFGWANASWGFDYTGELAAPMQLGPGIEDPIFVWMSPSTNSATPSGITRYRGREFPLWDGDFFVGQLSGRALIRLRIRGRNVDLQERMLMELDERIRDVRVGPDNRIYILTDQQAGRVLRLQPGQPAQDQVSRVALRLTSQLRAIKEADEEESPDDSVKGRIAFAERCSSCHSVGSRLKGGQLGPDLENVVGRVMGRKEGFKYSSAMAGSSQVWDERKLNLFLADPSAYAPGTAMASPPVIGNETRRQIIKFLKHN